MRLDQFGHGLEIGLVLLRIGGDVGGELSG